MCLGKIHLYTIIESFLSLTLITRRIDCFLLADLLQMRRFHNLSLTPGDAPGGRLPGAIDLLPLQGEPQIILILDFNHPAHRLFSSC